MKNTSGFFKNINLLVFIILFGILTACNDADDSHSPPSGDKVSEIVTEPTPKNPEQDIGETSLQTNEEQNNSAAAEVANTTTTTVDQAITTNSGQSSSRQQIEMTKVQPLSNENDRELKIVDLSEIQLDGANAIVITFSTPLSEKQSFDKVVYIIDAIAGKLDGAWELSDNKMELRFRHIEPKRDLVITVLPDIYAENGHTLDSEYRNQITTRDVPPSVGFASKGSLLPTKLVEGLPVVVQNVDSVDVNFYRIKPESLPAFLADWRYNNSGVSVWEATNYTDRATLVYSGRFDLNPVRNTRENVLLPIASIDSLKQPGIYFAVMSEAGKYNYYNPAMLFMLSDVAVSVHRYQDQLQVFTQHLESGKILPAVEITLLGSKGQEIDRGQTDQQGFLSIAKNDKAVLLVANYHGQTSLIDLSRPALDLAEFDINGEMAFNKQLFAFGPRDLYRPGEIILVNALLRDQDGQLLPEQPIQAEVLDPSNQVLKTFVWQPEEGLYQYQYQLPHSAATGNWHIRFNVGDQYYRYYQFKVEEFLPERMALDLTAASSLPVETDKTIEFDVKGRYLYGAPAAGNSLQGQLYLRPQRSLKGYDGFEFGSVSETNLSRYIGEIDIKLDQQGQGKVAVPSEWKESLSPMTLSLQVSLLESGGRPVTRRIEQAIWPAAQLPGIRADFAKTEYYDYDSGRYVSDYSVDVDSQASFEIVYANAKGERLAAPQLTVRLVKERRDYYWTWSQSNGWQSNYNQKELLLNEERIELAKDQIGKITFPVEWGSYRVEVFDPTTNVVSSIRFWAGYRWQDNVDGGALRPDQVKMKLNKPFYKAGDKAIVNVEAPAAGQGYLLVESNEGVLWSQAIKVPVGGADFSIPIDSRWKRHDIYLTAQVIRPADKQQQNTPKRAIGVLHLPLADQNRRLDISLSGPGKIRPEQTVTIPIKAKTTDGQIPEKIHVLVSAVDAGVLNITRYVTPDPFEAFLGRKRYGVDQFDVYGQLIDGKGRLAALRFGGDSDEEYSALSRGGKKPVTEVKIVAQQLQTVVLNEKGEGQVQLAIPDFNGELRIMAQGWNDNHFGKGEQTMVVAAPLVAELAMPRFMASGDQSTWALDVTNLTETQQQFNVNLRTEGLIKNSGQNSYSVDLMPQQRQTLHIPIQASYGESGFGQGRLTVTVDGIKIANEPDFTLSRSWTIGVRAPYPAVTSNYSSVLRAGESYLLPQEATNKLLPETVEAEVILTSRPPLNLALLIRELYAYPYGCAEQTTSGLFPSLYVNSDELNKMGIKTTSDDERRQRINIGIDRLLNMQRDDGSFGLWGKNSPEGYWLTAYVTDFLLRAREQGYQVDNKAMAKALDRLQRYLQDRSLVQPEYSQNNDYSRFAVRAYAGLVLAKQNRAPLGALRQLYSEKVTSVSGLPLVQLGQAMKLMGDTVRGDQSISEGLRTNNSNRAYWFDDYGSPLRDDALILSLMYENKFASDETDAKLFELANKLSSSRYLSTQERNAVFMAGRAFIGSDEQNWQATVKGRALSANKPYRQLLNAADLSTEVTIKNTGNTTLYPRINLTGYAASMPDRQNNGIAIERSYYDLKGNSISLNKLNSGELVLVALDLKVNDYVPDALVVDLLPAGLELENQNLADSSASLQLSSDNLRTLQYSMQNTVIAHQEFRDDRYVAALALDKYKRNLVMYLARAVTPGVYAVPAPIAESMYRANINGIGRTVDKLEVE